MTERFTQDQIDERKARIENIYIDHEQSRSVRQKLKTRLKSGTLPAGPAAKLTLLTAETGTGKSSTIEDFIRQTCPGSGINSSESSILYVSLPMPCSIKGMTEEILEALGDPLSQCTSTASRNSTRIIKIMTARKLRLFIIDEFQHLIDSDRSKILHATTDWLKVLLDKAKVPVVCVGLPNAIQIINSNAQLERRVTRYIEMRPFDWNNAGAILEFRAFLRYYEDNLPFDDPSNLNEPSLAEAIHQATGGYIGKIAQLLTEAAEVSMNRADGPDAILVPDLASAYEGFARKGLNPFALEAVSIHTQLSERVVNAKSGRRRCAIGKQQAA
jgi:type II secretory pathway predicted ATPase ExeA